ncbi:MAG: hypothetical protein JW936_03660 [Sedimentisphaerales bacterium]|nr:hypothetical protein [Sedimentisphaerales bacterium]
MGSLRNRILLGVLLVLASVVFYVLHYVIFRDAHHIFIYLVGDVAFVFIEVLMVTLVIHQLIEEREKKNRLEKLNMVIGSFFSEVGGELLASVSDFDPELEQVKQELVVNNDWSVERFKQAKGALRGLKYDIQVEADHLRQMREFLVARRDFMLRLLENPTLLEHEEFTDLLRAVFHLTEELTARKDLGASPDSDLKHMAGDIKRVYKILILEWLDYMRHLQKNYPFLFSLAVRQNPFDQTASVIVKG